MIMTRAIAVEREPAVAAIVVHACGSSRVEDQRRAGVVCAGVVLCVRELTLCSLPAVTWVPCGLT
jgi:hypothetical protein